MMADRNAVEGIIEAKYIKSPAEVGRDDKSREEVEKTVEEIMRAVRERGDSALKEFTRKFDGCEINDFRVSEEVICNEVKSLSDEIKNLIDFAISNVKKFAEAQLKSLKSIELEVLPGVHLGHKIIPVERVGAYVPGGRYPLLSSAVMSIVPAKVAGVSKVIACTPPGKDGKINPAILYAMKSSGADEIYAVGGAQAIAAMAFGTETIKAVDVIVGPGNKWVVEAKRQVYGIVGIDLLAGPSEILVIADETGDPEIIAADLLAQAEHDVDAKPILITTSEEVGFKVLEKIKSTLQELPTGNVASESWRRNGIIAIVPDLDQAALLSDYYAPEHLEVHVKDPFYMFDRLRNYGSLFLGVNAAVVFSDKNSGTNHILPTGRAARYTGGLWVGTFLKVVTYQWVEDRGVNLLSQMAAKQSAYEGLEGHRLSAAIRNRMLLEKE
ncbi:MAG: histidinol dehydrogenase [Nitrososphaerota archaeon]